MLYVIPFYLASIWGSAHEILWIYHLELLDSWLLWVIWIIPDSTTHKVNNLIIQNL